MTMSNLYSDLTLWKPTPTQIPEQWMKLAQELEREVKGSQRAYIMKVKYDAQRVGNLLRLWGLPWQVVIAGYLWEYEQEMIAQANLDEVNEVLSHIDESNLYSKYIEDEQLPRLLTPPYRDLGGLLIAVAIFYQALLTLQEQSNDRSYTGKMQSQIESVGRTLLNIAKSLGMWYFKREIEDLIEQLRSSRKYEELKKDHARLLEQDTFMLEETRQSLKAAYQEATKQPITVVCIPCFIFQAEDRIRDTHATAVMPKSQLTAFDLVTFEVI